MPDSVDTATKNNSSDYVEGWEFVTSKDSNVHNNWMKIRCADGDQYSAWFEDGAWWLPICAGDPGEGPFETPDDVVAWLNDEDA